MHSPHRTPFGMHMFASHFNSKLTFLHPVLFPLQICGALGLCPSSSSAMHKLEQPLQQHRKLMAHASAAAGHSAHSHISKEGDERSGVQVGGVRAGRAIV